MKKDILFLLSPGFYDNDRHEYCPECAEIWGVLAYYPALMHGVDIVYQPLSRPRTEIVELLSEQNQNCPTLIVNSDVELPETINVQTINDYRFLDNARDIGKYFHFVHGTAFPRGS